MTALLLGARGMLGADIIRAAPRGMLARALSRAEADLTNHTAIARALDTLRPSWIVNAAAYTAVDRAETEYELAHAVNATAVGALGRLCAERGIAVLHFSTDYVFSGDTRVPYRESDPTSPVNAYGRSKLAGEEALLASGAAALIVRAQWLFGVSGRSFPRTMLERATRGLETRVVDDQFGRPTATADLALAAWTLMQREARGVYHVANEGVATWYDVAAAIFSARACHDLRPCPSSDYPTPARRPAFSVLDTTKVERDYGVRLPPWRDALERFLRTMDEGASPISA